MSRNVKILYWWTLAAVMVPNIMLCLSEHMTLLQSAANIVLPLGIVWLLMSLTRRVGLSVWALILLMVVGAFQIVLLSIYGRSVIAVDMFLNVVTTNSAEAGELLKGMLPAVGFVTFLYLPPLVMATVAIVRRQTLPKRLLHTGRCCAGVTAVAGLLLVLICLSPLSATPYKPLRQLYPLNAFYNLGLAMNRTEIQSHYPDSAQDFRFYASESDSLPGVTMIVIGETSRASNWQLFGYNRPTTPLLASRSDIVAFGRALSQSNTTHKSVPLMLSHLRAEEFGDSIYKVKSIITAFREAGCPTVFISDQDHNHALIDCFGAEADRCIFLADTLGPSRNDLDLLPVVSGVLSALPRDRKSLVVVHTYGSHFNYNDRYPSSGARFLPDTPLKAEPGCRQRLVNAYDNSVMLTDRLLASLMSDIEKLGINGSIIYTSDHGEDIYDDSRRLFLHASPIPTFEQLHVPMILWMSPALKKARSEQYAAASANSRFPVMTSASVFPTAMQIAGITAPGLDPTQSLVSSSYIPQPYTYLDDHNEAFSPAEAGLDAADISRINALYTVAER